MIEYEGWGVWLIAGVLAFNLACIPAWFLVRNLTRTFEFELKKAKTFLFVLEQERDRKGAWRKDSDLDLSIRTVQEQISEAEGKGALWGRRSMALVTLSLHQVADKWPELAEKVSRRMTKGAAKEEEG